MVYSQFVRGHVGPERTAGRGRAASANPIFTWVRLAQRVPVRIYIDQAPDGVLPGSWHDSYRAD